MLVKCNECGLGKLIVQLSCDVTGYKTQVASVGCVWFSFNPWVMFGGLL